MFCRALVVVLCLHLGVLADEAEDVIISEIVHEEDVKATHIAQKTDADDYLESFCAGKADKIHQDPKYCDKYITCKENHAVSLKCPSDFLYNVNEERCDSPDNVECSTEPSNKLLYDLEEATKENDENGDPSKDSLSPNDLDDFCAGKAARNYADPTSCSKYVICNGREAVSMNCPSNLWYNFHEDKCDVVSNVDCVHDELSDEDTSSIDELSDEDTSATDEIADEDISANDELEELDEANEDENNDADVTEANRYVGGYQFVSYNYPSYKIGVNKKSQAYIMRGKSQSFRIVKPGLNGLPGSISLESMSQPGFYLRHQNGLLKLHPYTNQQLYKDDATWFMRRNKFYRGYVSFEASNYRNHFLRHQNYRLKMMPFINQRLYKMDASFKIRGDGKCARVKCSSWWYKHKTCRIPRHRKITEVSLHRQLSWRSCVHPKRFGIRNNKLWVHKGCRGIFTYCWGGRISTERKSLTACEHKTLKLACSPSYVLNIKNAAYGRSERSTCRGWRWQLKSTRCNAGNSKAIVERECSGRRMCKVKASNSVFGDPCVGTFKYLTVTYSCVPKIRHKRSVGYFFTSYNYPAYTIGFNNRNQAYIMKGQQQSFRIIRPGLNGRRGSVSLESTAKPGFYLRHQGGLLKLHTYSNQRLYKDDATWFMRRNKFFRGYVAFESSNYRNHFLRHQNYRLKKMAYQNTNLFKMDASFKIGRKGRSHGSCEVNPESRIECGYAGITKATCEGRGCCYNPNWKNSRWCYKKDDSNSRCMMNPESRIECGWPGITKKQCESHPGCCYNDKTRGTKFCYLGKGGKEAPPHGVCDVNPESRAECGYAGITKGTCEGRGCCFNPNFKKSKWCYKKDTSDDQCMVNPENRIECGWPGIKKHQCESRPGCCYNDKTAGTKFCYLGQRVGHHPDRKTTPKPAPKPVPTKYVPPKTQQPDPFCVGKKARNYPDPKSCNSFISCSGGMSIKLTCPPKLWYSYKKDECVKPANSDCKVKHDEVNEMPNDVNGFCIGKASGNYPDPDRCDGFISCSGPMAYRMDCPAKLFYNYGNDQCDWPENVACTLHPTKVPTTILPTPGVLDVFCDGKKSRNYPDPKDCSGFISCNRGMAVKMECPTNLWYSFKEDECVTPMKSECKILLSEDEEADISNDVGDFCIAKSSGNYADPYRCDGYIACNGRIAYRMDCPVNLYYNFAKDQCDWPKNVACGGESMTKLDCFKQHSIKGLKAVLLARSKIKWDKKGYTKFLKQLLNDCTKIAKSINVDRFALVNYGECWVVPNDGSLRTAAITNQCTRGDGSFLSCNSSNAGPCVGMDSTAFVYSLKALSNYGCYRQYTISGLKLVLYKRTSVPWGKKGFSKFINDFIHECRRVTESQGYDKFAIIFYAECWIVTDDHALKSATPTDQCEKADGTFLPCNVLSSDEKCVGKNGTAFIYAITEQSGEPVPVTAAPTTTASTTPAEASTTTPKPRPHPHPHGFCSGKKSRNYADPERCDGFISCSSGSAYKMECPAGLWYDYTKDQCDYPDNVNCQVIAPVTKKQESPVPTGPVKKDSFCVGKKSKNYPDPVKCGGFISCEGNSATRFACPEGQWYDAKKDQCGDPRKVNCQADHAHFCAGKKSGTYPVPAACNKFYSCSDGKGIVKTCTKHRNYDPARSECVWTTTYSCADPSFCKGKKDGNYKNINNCYGYYRCMNGNTVDANCSSATRFNGKKCVEPHLYVCH